MNKPIPRADIERVSRAISEGNSRDFANILSSLPHFPEDLALLIQATNWMFEEYLAGGEPDADGFRQLLPRTHQAQDEIFLPLMASVAPAWWQGAEYLLRTMAKEGRQDVIPELHARHFSLPDTPMNQAVIGRALGGGTWPHPDLILPNVMNTRSGTKAFRERLAQMIYAGDGSFFTVEHATRVCALHFKRRHSFRKELRTEIQGGLSKDIDFPLDAVDALLILEKGDLIKIDKFAPSYASQSVKDLAAAAQAEKQRRELEKSAPQSAQAAPLRRM